MKPPRGITAKIREAIKKAGGTPINRPTGNWMQKLGLDVDMTPFSVIKALEGDIPEMTRNEWEGLNKYLINEGMISQQMPYPMTNPEGTRQALDRIAEYQGDMQSQLLFGGMGRITNNNAGETTLTGTPSILTHALDSARRAEIEPVGTAVRDRTLRIADRLNRGMETGENPNVTSSELLGVDWGLLQQNVDLPMDEASRMARAREQGYVYGIDEDILRGVPVRGNSRNAPGIPAKAVDNMRDPDFQGNFTQWGSSDPRIARSYTQFPQGSDFTRPMYLEDFSNQDYLTGLPQMEVFDFNTPAGVGSPGTATFRMVGRATPFEYRGEGEGFNYLLPEERVFVNGQPWTQVPGFQGWLPDEGNTDETLRSINAFTRNVWGEEPTGVVFRNIVDPGPNRQEVPPASDVYALPLARVRNRDLAMFHPLLRGQRALLGGVAGAALLPYGIDSTE